MNDMIITSNIGLCSSGFTPSFSVPNILAYESNLWRSVALELGIKGELAIDVGAGGNDLAARGMRSAGIERVALLDIESCIAVYFISFMHRY